MKQKQTFGGGGGSPQLQIRPDTLRTNYLRAVAKLYADQVLAFGLMQEAQKNCQLSYQPQLEEDARTLGINLRALSAELRRLTGLQDPSIREMRLDEFVKRNEVSLKKLYEKFGSSRAANELTPKFIPGKKQFLRLGKMGGLSIEDDPPRPLPTRNADLRLIAPFSFSGGELGQDSGVFDVKNDAIPGYTKQKSAFIGQVVTLPVGVRRFEFAATLSAFQCSAMVVGTEGYANSQVYLTLRLLTPTNRLLIQEQRSMAHMIATVTGAGTRTVEMPISILAHYTRPNPNIEERFHLTLTVECLDGSGGSAFAMSSAKGTLEHFSLWLI